MKQLLKTIAKPLLLLTLAVGTAVFLPELAQAATEPEDVEKTIASLLSIGIDFLNALLWPFLLIIGELMDTDMILGPGMEEKLKAIWIPVRDLVNIGFVLVLLVVAFYNVLGIGGGEGDLALKTALPKIVLGLVLVNFTFIGGKVVLDLVNVATTAAFALPELASDETPYDFSGVKEEFQQKVCYKSVDEAGNATPWSDATDGEENIPIHTRLFCTKADDGTYNELDGLLAAQYFTDLNANNIGLVMAVNMGGLSSLSVLKAESIDSFSDLTISIMFALVMYLVFATSYLVLGIVLLARIIVLWIALALSPLAVLVYVVPQIKEWAGGGGDVTQKIIKTLLAPVIIGLTMSLGYIMIDAWDGNLALDGGGFKANEVISKEFLIEGMDDLPQFIIALASILIVWTGVFAAASDTYASFATEAIKGFGDQVKDFAYKLPMSIPTVPLSVGAEGKEKPVSLMALKMWGENAMSGVTNGTWAMNQLEGLPEGTNFFGIPINTKGIENRNPDANRQALMAEVRNTAPFDYNRAAEATRNLVNMIGSGSLKGTAQTTLIDEVRRTKEQYERGEITSLEPLKKLLKDHTYEELGFKDESQYREVRGSLDRATWNNLPPPTRPGTSPPQTVTPAQTAAIKAAVDLALPTTPLGTQVAPLKATGIPAPAATVGTDLEAAQTALTTLQTTPNTVNLTAARKAVDDAIAHAVAAQGDAAVTGAVKTSVDTAHAELVKIKARLDPIRI